MKILHVIAIFVSILCIIHIWFNVEGIYRFTDHIKEWHISCDQSLIDCIFHSVYIILFDFGCILFGFTRTRDDNSEKSLCRNCFKRGMMINEDNRLLNITKRVPLTIDDSFDQVHAK